MSHLRKRSVMLVATSALAFIPIQLPAWQEKPAPVTVEFLVIDGWGNALGGDVKVNIRQAGKATSPIRWTIGAAGWRACRRENTP